MRLDRSAALAVLGTFISVTDAFPRAVNHMAELRALMKSESAAVEMTGDIPRSGPTTETGQAIRDCLLGDVSCESHVVSRAVLAAGELGSPECKADKCCAFEHLGKELRKTFVNKDGQCTQSARASIRLGFHDASGWAKGAAYGGADGSLILNDEEIKGDHNQGLEDIRNQARQLYNKYNKYGVGAADLVQFMATTGIVSCPLGPRVRTYVGRPDNKNPPPTGLVPDHEADPSTLIKLFADKGFSTTDLAALIGAHTSANQFTLSEATVGHSMDSTPGIWDVKFYGETLASSKIANVSRVPSDMKFAKDGRTSIAMTVFSVVQPAWNAVFAQAYVRASLLGVGKASKLTDCTRALPAQLLAVPKKGSNPNGAPVEVGAAKIPAGVVAPAAASAANAKDSATAMAPAAPAKTAASAKSAAPAKSAASAKAAAPAKTAAKAQGTPAAKAPKAAAQPKAAAPKEAAPKETSV